jgi:hypothetical protein
MPELILWNDYTRKDVHHIFSPHTEFTPQAGTWGAQGMVRVPSRRGDWVFFVTFGQQQGDHVFDESITEDGVLSWQSQPAQRLQDAIIQELISHDVRVNNVHLFLRTAGRRPYTYLGTLGYLTHDNSRERPVHFQWQILDWPTPDGLTDRIGLSLLPTAIGSPPTSDDHPENGLIFAQPPNQNSVREGVSTEKFRRRKAPDYAARDARNRDLGASGEELVIKFEKAKLENAGLRELAELVTHVSKTEGDSAGYDVRSYELNGAVLYIEVKTTEGGADTGFFISANEVAFSLNNGHAYALYRLYEFNRETQTAKVYVLRGNIAQQVQLSPMTYRVDPRAIAQS